MDKTLLKAYIRTVVEEHVEKILPQLLSEVIQQVKVLKENSPAPVPAKSTTRSPIDKAKLRELMGVSFDGETLTASTDGMPTVAPQDLTPGQQEVHAAVNKNYSELMRAMGI